MKPNFLRLPQIAGFGLSILLPFCGSADQIDSTTFSKTTINHISKHSATTSELGPQFKTKIGKISPDRARTEAETKALQQARVKRAGGGDTGGGSVVLTYGKNHTTGKQIILKAELYDLWEAERRYLDPKPMVANFEGATTVEDTLALGLARIAKVDPILAMKMQDEIKNFSINSGWICGEGQSCILPDATDLHPIVMPKEHSNQAVHAAVLQKEDHYPQERDFNLREDYVHALSPQHYAALIMHEVLLKHARHNQLCLQNSTDVRHFNALVWADAIGDADTYQQDTAPAIAGYSWDIVRGLLVYTFTEYDQEALSDRWIHVAAGELQTNLGILKPDIIEYNQDNASEEGFTHKDLTVYFPDSAKVCGTNACAEDPTKAIVLLADDGTNTVERIYRGDDVVHDLYLLDKNGFVFLQLAERFTGQAMGTIQGLFGIQAPHASNEGPLAALKILLSQVYGTQGLPGYEFTRFKSNLSHLEMSFVDHMGAASDQVNDSNRCLQYRYDFTNQTAAAVIYSPRLVGQKTQTVQIFRFTSNQWVKTEAKVTDFDSLMQMFSVVFP